MTMKLKILFVAAVVTLGSAGSVYARTPVHGAGSSHHPIIQNPSCNPGDRKCPNQPTRGRRP